ncbi:hypothetical protein HK414_28145 [Ramlibacter terrae]|uniref:Uncharacterized protein n=1 Tax=Ramlibacter terrae TaxID=2732511 RepID=A0ABX6P794_9BURK|nr:hypothetical protein HK414_28145 [Ramlibacter terrae]
MALPRKKPQPFAPSSGLSRLDSTKPFTAARNAATAQPANRKHERMARRELLYGVVREAMVRAGVLSASYKFKVLSLDPRGRQFMVMVDLAQGARGETTTTQLAEIEATIAQSAKQRHDILVTAVYWRSNEHVAVGDPVARAPQQQRPRPSRPIPLQAAPVVSAPAPLFEEVSQPAQLEAAPPTRAHSGFDPLHPEEVAAFKRALAMGVSGKEAVATGPKGTRNPALLTGFEDTEMAEAAEDAERLSGTQYGELR